MEIPIAVIQEVINNVLKKESWQKYRVHPETYTIIVDVAEKEKVKGLVYRNSYRQNGHTIIYVAIDLETDPKNRLFVLLDNARKAVAQIPQERKSIALIPASQVVKPNFYATFGQRQEQPETYHHKENRFQVKVITSVEVKDKKTGMVEVESSMNSSAFDMAERAAKRLKLKLQEMKLDK